MTTLSTLNGEYWLGDLVERRFEARNGRHLVDQHFVNHIDFSDGPWAVYGDNNEIARCEKGRCFTLALTTEFHPAYTLSYLGVTERTCGEFKVIRRGNLWRNVHQEELLPFESPENEAFFYYAIGEAEIASDIKVSSLQELLALIDAGKLDGCFTTEQVIVRHIANQHGVILNDKAKGREVADHTLNHHNYKNLRRWLRKQFS